MRRLNPEIGYIYILKNDAFPHLLKIGYTTRKMEHRVKELQTTGVPGSYKVVYQVETINPKEKEQQIHSIMWKCRAAKSEFFEISIANAKNIIDKVIEELKPPKAPEPPALTEKEQEERKITIESILRSKYDNRQKNIHEWIKNLTTNLYEEKNQRKGIKGKVKYLFASNPKTPLQDYETAIKKASIFKKAYTYQFFLMEHESVQGLDHIMLQKYRSKILEEYLGLKVRLDMKKIEETGFYFEADGSFLFKITGMDLYSYYRNPLMCFEDWDECIAPELLEDKQIKKEVVRFTQRHGYDKPYFTTRSLGHFNNYSHFYEKYVPKNPEYYLYSDELYKKRWKKRWLKDWWEKNDPNGFSPQNPHIMLRDHI